LATSSIIIVFCSACHLRFPATTIAGGYLATDAKAFPTRGALCGRKSGSEGTHPAGASPHVQAVGLGNGRRP